MTKMLFSVIQNVCSGKLDETGCHREGLLPVDINGLQQAEGHPGPEEEHVVTEDHDANEEPSAQDERFSRVSIFSLHAKRSLGDSWGEFPVVPLCLSLLSHVDFTHSELVVDFVDVFVDPAVVKQSMEEVVPRVFNHRTAKALSQEVRPGEGHSQPFH